jgi:hypothetical protein
MRNSRPASPCDGPLMSTVATRLQAASGVRPWPPWRPRRGSDPGHVRESRARGRGRRLRPFRPSRQALQRPISRVRPWPGPSQPCPASQQRVETVTTSPPTARGRPRRATVAAWHGLFAATSPTAYTTLWAVPSTRRGSSSTTTTGATSSRSSRTSSTVSGGRCTRFASSAPTTTWSSRPRAADFRTACTS